MAETPRKASNTNGLRLPKSLPIVPQKHPKNDAFGDSQCFWGLFGGKSGCFWEKGECFSNEK